MRRGDTPRGDIATLARPSTIASTEASGAGNVFGSVKDWLSMMAVKLRARTLAAPQAIDLPIDSIGLVDPRPEVLENVAHRRVVFENPAVFSRGDADFHALTANGVDDGEWREDTAPVAGELSLARPSAGRGRV